MIKEHEIVRHVYEAQQSADAADAFVRQYLPFIKAETAKFIKKIPVEGDCDELSIAMFAFHEAAMAYRREKGAFLKLAAVSIRNRLIDFQRSESRHSGGISLDQPVGGEEDSRTLMEQLDTGHDNISQHQSRSASREELLEFAQQLRTFGLELSDIADNCPKQDRTLQACHRALAYAKRNPLLLEQLISSKKVPLAALADGSGVERKTLERHRKYLVAILLAYTNGFEIIRGHLRQIAPVKGD